MMAIWSAFLWKNKTKTNMSEYLGFSWVLIRACSWSSVWFGIVVLAFVFEKELDSHLHTLRLHQSIHQLMKPTLKCSFLINSISIMHRSNNITIPYYYFYLCQNAALNIVLVNLVFISIHSFFLEEYFIAQFSFLFRFKNFIMENKVKYSSCNNYHFYFTSFVYFITMTIPDHC